MKRWFGAVALLLAGVVGLAHGEYVIIRVNLGLSKDDQANQPGGPAGAGGPTFPGMGPGGPMGPGVGLGNPGKGQAGGAMPPPGMQPGNPNGGKGGPTFPGGQGGPTFPGGRPANDPNGPGMRGPGGPGGFGAASEEVEESAPLYVAVVVEVKNAKEEMPGVLRVTHKWGTSKLLTIDPTQSVDVILMRMPPPDNRSIPTILQRYELKHREAHKDPKPSAEQLLELARWTLGHALFPQFAKVMDELEAVEKDHPAVKAYRKVQADMAKPVPENEATARWKKDLLTNYKTTSSTEGHYTLFYDSAASDPLEVTSRLNRLESTYQAFFYWFALQGKVLALPEQRLLTVLVPKREEFERKHQIFDSVPLVADGFLARRDNLAVYSATRMDEGYEALVQRTSQVWPIFGPKEGLLKGKLNIQPQNLAQLSDSLKAQTYAVLMKALEEESELATVSHEGTRQLLGAAGFPGVTPLQPLLPRAVAAPEWVQFGMGSFFETPKGSPWSSIAMPSPTLMQEFNYLSNYKLWLKGKKLDKPQVALESVVGDKYFRQAYALQRLVKEKDTEKDKDKEKENDKARDKARQALIKARTMAWSLNYFLAHHKLDGLLRYYQELAKLPRDLDFDDDVLMRCFGRAFDLLDTNGKPDAVRVTKLANDWVDFVNFQTLEGEDLIREVQKKSELRTSGGTPAPKP